MSLFTALHRAAALAEHAVPAEGSETITVIRAYNVRVYQRYEVKRSDVAGLEEGSWEFDDTIIERGEYLGEDLEPADDDEFSSWIEAS